MPLSAFGHLNGRNWPGAEGQPVKANGRKRYEAGIHSMTAVHSWGWGVCGDICGDCYSLPGTNSSFGDLSGLTAVFSHTDWIRRNGSAVAEPKTYALMLAVRCMIDRLRRSAASAAARLAA